MSKYNQDEIAASLKDAIDNLRDDVVAILAEHVDKSACKLECIDGDADDALVEGCVFVVSERTLLINDVEVAGWTRCACGHYGDQGRSEMVGVWCVDEDTDGGDGLPEIVAVLLDAVGLEDNIPDVSEPVEPNHPVDPDGEWCVHWETVGNDTGPLKRYATQKQAEEMCEVYARHFAAANGGTMMCGHSVRQLVDGKWCWDADE